MDKQEKVNLDDVFNFNTEEVDEEITTNNMDEIIQNKIEEGNNSIDNYKKYISKYNKDNLSSAEDKKSEKLPEEPDLVEKLLENQNIDNGDEIKIEKEKYIEQKKTVNICPNKKQIKFPEELKNNPSPIDFIDFMERKYNKYLLDKERDKYFYLEKCEKEKKYKEVK